MKPFKEGIKDIFRSGVGQVFLFLTGCISFYLVMGCFPLMRNASRCSSFDEKPYGRVAVFITIGILYIGRLLKRRKNKRE